MIKFKMGKLAVILDTINSLALQELKVNLAYPILKILRALDAEAVLYNETIKNIKHKYAKRDDDGKLLVDEHGNIHCDVDNKSKFENELNEFMSMDISVECPKIKLSQLIDGGAKLKPVYLETIEDFIEIDI